MNEITIHCQKAVFIISQSYLNQRVKYFTKDDFLNSYVFLYIGLICTFFLVYYLLQKKSSKFNVNTLKNLYEYQTESEHQYYFLYLGIIFPASEIFYFIIDSHQFNELRNNVRIFNNFI